jgi:hypothetical protein
MHRHPRLVFCRAGVHVLDHRSAPGDEAKLVVVGSRFAVGDERWQRVEEPGPRPAAVQETLEDVGKLLLEDLAKAWEQVVGLPELRHAGTVPTLPGVECRCRNRCSVALEDRHLVTVARQHHRRRHSNHSSTADHDVHHFSDRGRTLISTRVLISVTQT